MKRKKFSLKEYFRDERNRKAFFVGLIVFIIVLIGLNLYHKNMESKQGDLILTGGAGIEGDGNEAGSDGFSDAEGSPEDGLIGQAGGGAAEGGISDGDNTGDAAAMNQAGQGGTSNGVIFVDVGGAVHMVGLYALPSGSRVADAIEAAGGLREEAEMKYMNRAAILSDGDRLYIPTAGEVQDGAAPPSVGQVTASGGYTGGASQGAGGDSGAGAASGSNSAGNGLININTASSEELQKLNGVGPATAQKIIDYRTKSGGFKRIEDILNVSGIGAKTFEKLKDYITV